MRVKRSNIMVGKGWLIPYYRKGEVKEKKMKVRIVYNTNIEIQFVFIN